MEANFDRGRTRQGVARNRTARHVAAYGPIKAANLLQTRQWGVEYARDGIRVVSVSPGAINTPMVQATLQEQGGAEEVYILGFDLSTYDEPLNNVYKGTDNYLSSDAKGFNSTNWINQMQTVFTEFRDIKFYWIDPVDRFGQKDFFQNGQDGKFNNLSYLTKDSLCDKLNIL